MRLAEAVRPRNLTYERTVRRLLRASDGWEQKAVRNALQTITELQEKIAVQLLRELAGDPNRVNVEALKSALQQTIDRLIPELAATMQDVYGAALAEYTDGYLGFYKSIGLSGPLAGRGVSADLAVIAANLTTEQVVAVTPQAIQSITRQVQLAVLGGQNPMDAIQALAGGDAGPSFRAIGPFKTLRQRAEADVRTEIHRMFNVADESQHKQLSQEVPGTLFYWYQFSKRDPRSTHTATAVQSQTNPIGPNELFNVGGFKAAHPHDPRLPAREVVNCNCKKFPDFRNVDLEAIARRSAIEAGEQASVETIRKKAAGATAQQAPDLTSKRKTKKRTRAGR